jgi:hypothetical protein
LGPFGEVPKPPEPTPLDSAPSRPNRLLGSPAYLLGAWEAICIACPFAGSCVGEDDKAICCKVDWAFAVCGVAMVAVRNTYTWPVLAWPETSDAEGVTLCSRVHALTVSVWSGVPLSLTCPVLSHLLSVRTFACVQQCVARMRPALCGPHSRPHASPRWRSRLRLSGLLARAWARAVSVPSAPTFHTRPSACVPSPPALPACRPSRLSLLRRAQSPVATPANQISSWDRVAPSWESVAPNLAPQPGFLPRRRRGRSLPSPCARLPSLGNRMYPQAPPTRSRSLVILGLAQGVGFFPGSAETPPLVVLRKNVRDCVVARDSSLHALPPSPCTCPSNLETNRVNKVSIV